MNIKMALATAHNIEVIMETSRRALRIVDVYARLRSFRLEMWQPHNRAVAGRNDWMPHDEEASTFDLEQNSTYNDDAWKIDKTQLFSDCTGVHKSLVD